jgi:hypothetical protein
MPSAPSRPNGAPISSVIVMGIHYGPDGCTIFHSIHFADDSDSRFGRPTALSTPPNNTSLSRWVQILGPQPAVLAAVEWGCMTSGGGPSTSRRVTATRQFIAVSGFVSGGADRLELLVVNQPQQRRKPDGYSSRSASTGAALDARSAGSSDAASTVARDVAAAMSSVRESPGAMP